MKPFIIRTIHDYPEAIQQAGEWFSEKWEIPPSAYIESMEDSLGQKKVPEWYFIWDDHKNIIAGAGVIDNDFHNRRDLSPNVCVLFVENEYRGQGIAKQLLNHIREEYGKKGFNKLYLVTDHTQLYEKYGWQYSTMVMDDDGENLRMYEADTL